MDIHGEDRTMSAPFPVVRSLPAVSEPAQASADEAGTTTSRVAARLAELYRRGSFAQAQAELFAQGAVSTGPVRAGRARGRGWPAPPSAGQPFLNRIAHLRGIDVAEPLVAGKVFSVSMSLDSTVVGHGRLTADELCVYCIVEDGKIVSEQFFYTIEG
jgi:hypothetical protein